MCCRATSTFSFREQGGGEGFLVLAGPASATEELSELVLGVGEEDLGVEEVDWGTCCWGLSGLAETSAEASAGSSLVCEEQRPAYKLDGRDGSHSSGRPTSKVF